MFALPVRAFFSLNGHPLGNSPSQFRILRTLKSVRFMSLNGNAAEPHPIFEKAYALLGFRSALHHFSEFEFMALVVYAFF
jgi:hypothetical protein